MLSFVTSQEVRQMRSGNQESLSATAVPFFEK
jgi:hypothetical protein